MSIGIEWVNNYHGRPGLANLSNNDDLSRGFYNTLQGVKQFEWEDDWAWDQDFEQSETGTPPTGGDIYWADNVDICLFSGHGAPNGPLFGVTNYDDGQEKPTESRLGNRQLEWIIFDACQVLQYDNGGVFSRWGWPVFKGLHYILGFHTTTGDSATRGRIFAEKLNAGWTIRTAWIRACEETEGSATEWAYLRAANSTADTSNDHWWGKGTVSSDPVNPTYLVYQKGVC